MTDRTITRPGIEQNRLKRAWIWFWFSVPTRFLFVMLPGFALFMLPIAHLMGARGYGLQTFLVIAYAVVFCWAMVDNDFDTNLRRIGRDVDRKPRPEPPHNGTVP